MELTRYVGDRLHDILGISDKYITDYFIGLAGKSASAASFIQQLRDSDTVSVDETMIAFAQELWNKVSRCVLYRVIYNHVFLSWLSSAKYTEPVSWYV